MKFNIDELEDKLKNISNESHKITESLQKSKNKKKIELIVFTFMAFISYDYYIQKKEYLNFVNNFSEAYLLGDERYINIGNDYTFQDYYNEIDDNLKFKMKAFLFFLSMLYESLS